MNISQSFRLRLPKVLPALKIVFANVFIAIAYYGLAELSRNLASTPNSVTPVWPPDGLAVGATLMYGNWMLPGVFLGSFLANIQAFWSLASLAAFLISVLGVLGIAAGTTLGTWLGTSLLRRTTRQRYPFNRVPGAIKFLLYAGMIGPMVNATVGVAMLVFTQTVPMSAYTSIWPVWWISNVAGIFIVSPVLLSGREWLRSLKQRRLAQNLTRDRKQADRLQRKGFEVLVLATSVFFVGKASLWNNYPIAYMLIPLLVWATFRFGQLGATLTMFFTAALAILGTVRGLGTFASDDVNQSLMGLQSFIAVVVFTSLILMAVLAERAQAESRLRQAFSELQVSNSALEQYSQQLVENNQRLERALHELSRTQAQMIQSEKMSALGNLVAGVAHEINNPIGFLKGNIQPALEYVQDLLDLIDLYSEQSDSSCDVIEDKIDEIDLEFLREDLPKLIGSMNQGVKRIENISTSLRTFSRADSDRPVPFNLHDGMESTILILKHRLKANEKRPAIKVDTHYGDIPEVECYAGQLNQVFMNILANAIDALDQSCQELTQEALAQCPRQITITSELLESSPINKSQTNKSQTNKEDKGQSVAIRIKDNGTGMPEEIKNKIFDHLFTTKEVGQGTGLGLSIVHQIVTEKHGGSLRVDSVPGEGSEFVIILPVQFDSKSA